MISGNKGEWSEIYTLLKLLSDGKLTPGDENINKLKGVFYPIVKILRTESNSSFEYSINDDIVIISSDKEELLRIPMEEFKIRSLYLFEKIKENKQNTFAVPEIESFMSEIKCISLKADSKTKSDIQIVIHDLRTNQQPTLGFSIKSQIGNPSTLLNPGKPTNFIFKVTGLNYTEDIEYINSIFIKKGEKLSRDIKGRINEILKRNGNLEFVKIENQIFGNNLALIDSLLPNILSEIVFDFYASKRSKLIELVEHAQENNPLNFDLSNNHKFYSYKIKKLLTDIALGMTPTKVWTGEYHATGGYLIVKNDGEIVCYHIYNKNEFENYLLTTTKLDTASTSRYEFGDLYIEKDTLYFKLNLQIRFIK
ncbi:HpaII family restriction endonuclease [Flavobacterium anhuiense]|uniref:HpaII family restriction endonuclease n=1 Tax=Flavobacterium anhuiense TaxID=459526 RepID=UPI0020263D62|nr:HpaII family restriction endonuclease [Flavobacterium anhuiense]URM38149.1 HpaII family restriction endonuclease [Flavobacterium anhuiense]